MIFEGMNKQDTKREMVFHLVMCLIWVAVMVMAIIHKEKITWVFGVTAVAYLALDELINVFFFWRQYGRISKVSKEVDKTTAKKE